MNYGCVPIVSNISCISDYVQNNKNGFLIEKPTKVYLKEKIEEAILLNKNVFEQWINNNYDKAKKFTYKYYNFRLKKEILNNQTKD